MFFNLTPIPAHEKPPMASVHHDYPVGGSKKGTVLATNTAPDPGNANPQSKACLEAMRAAPKGLRVVFAKKCKNAPDGRN